ncbi:hypothetical protein [Nonomuraea antri]|uniref:hypothetical protein n=1 Tax=Nonomuraea antri TaxID=2730852 RepID=UPI001C2C7D02|nr:hypothetical protein [Nonomuraea antri]
MWPVAAAVVTAVTTAGLGVPHAYASDTHRPDNAVIVWDRNAEAAIWDVARQQPQVQARSFAMVHGAVYDAVNAIAGTPYQPYLTAPAADGTESTDAAVASAAYHVLDELFPPSKRACGRSTTPTWPPSPTAAPSSAASPSAPRRPPP